MDDLYVYDTSVDDISEIYIYVDDLSEGGLSVDDISVDYLYRNHSGVWNVSHHRGRSARHQ